ncbi:MAG: sugar transferase [Clostridiales bacterium]|nr:sugar transferase [Clostridiales bacterium]MDR2751840.1 sugar transferase [Clostridiales bacterium]
MYHSFKRLIDFFASLCLLLILSPLFLVLYLAVRIESKGPAFFKQKRVGRRQRIFWIYKFRTMRIDTPRDVPTHLMDRPDKYVTKMGAFLRRFSLDEIPQLYNILKGEMSIVGPRPALWNQFDLINIRESYNVNSIRPGLTGWAQVNGRDELPIPVKAKFDKEYLEKESFLFDLGIIFTTAKKALAGEGIKR